MNLKLNDGWLLGHMLHLHSVLYFLSSMKTQAARFPDVLQSPVGDRPLAFLLFWSDLMFSLCISHLLQQTQWVCLSTQTWGLCFQCRLFTGGEKVWFPCSSLEILIPCRCMCVCVCVCVCVCGTEYQAHRSGGSYLIMRREWRKIIWNKEMKSSVCCYSVLFDLSFETKYTFFN